MFAKVFKLLSGAAALMALTACGGAGESIDAAVPAATPIRLLNAASASARAEPGQDGVSGAERQAEEERMIGYEQAFSREMNRRYQDADERRAPSASGGGISTASRCGTAAEWEARACQQAEQ